jgi:hypothetical protein
VDGVDISLDKNLPPDAPLGVRQIHPAERRGVEAFDPRSPGAGHELEPVVDVAAGMEVGPGAAGFDGSDDPAFVRENKRLVEVRRQEARAGER